MTAAPHAVQLSAGNYAWCTCGTSATAPLCDGRSGCQPQPFTVRPRDAGSRLWLCGCGRSRTAPLCDGSHNRPAP